MQTTGFIGVLALDTAFERIVGDAGNIASYHLPAKIAVVENAGSTDIVRDGRPDPALITAFRSAAQQLEADGAIALVSTCGFLITAQEDIARSVSIPVMVSALSLFPVVRAVHGARPVGIITASSDHLGPVVLHAAGIPRGQTAIAGLQDDDDFASCFLVPKSQQPPVIDRCALRSAVVNKAMALCRSSPDMTAILLECGNLPPYSQAISAATNRSVYSILDGVRFLIATAHEDA